MTEIIVINATGSQKARGKLYESGVIHFNDGSISHVLFEKQFNKEITKFVEQNNEVKPEVKENNPPAFGKAKKATTKK